MQAAGSAFSELVLISSQRIHGDADVIELVHVLVCIGLRLVKPAFLSCKARMVAGSMINQ